MFVSIIITSDGAIQYVNQVRAGNTWTSHVTQPEIKASSTTIPTRTFHDAPRIPSTGMSKM